MSLNIGNGLITAHITEQRLRSIKESTLPLEVTLWEKIKDFFCHTQHEAALNCLHRLYHHDSLKMSEDGIRETFFQLKYLASPGCRNRFVIDKNNDECIYKINNEIIFSRSINSSACFVNQNNDAQFAIRKNDDSFDNYYESDRFYDCYDNYHISTDCIDDASAKLLQQKNGSDEYEIAPAAKTIVVEQEKRALDMLECIKILKPEIITVIQDTNKYAATRSLGVLGGIKAMNYGTRLLKNFYSPEVDCDKLKKELKKLLNLTGFEELIPSRIREMPEYVFVRQLSLSSE